MKKKERAVVLSQECIATDIYSMWIETPDIAAEAIPGQFITLYTKDADKLLPRPISLCEIDKKMDVCASYIELPEQEQRSFQPIRQAMLSRLWDRLEMAFRKLEKSQW